MLAVASIGPCKWFAAVGITSKVSPRRGESTHLRPKSRLTAVGLRNAPAGAAPYNPLLLFITNYKVKATPHNSRLTAQAPLRRLRHGICVAKMLDNVGLRYPHRASGAKAPRTLRPLPLLRLAVSATGGAHLCSIQYYLRFWLSSCRTSLAVSALRIMRYCLRKQNTHDPQRRRPSVRRSFYNKSTTIKQRQFMACGLQKSAYIDRRIIFASNNNAYMIK